MKSGNQTETGKAFEYSCAKAIEDKFKARTRIIYEESPQLETAKNFYECLDALTRIEYDKGATAAVKVIERLEPQLTSGEPLYLRLQSDAKGVAGDVRDVLCDHGGDWQIGLSCKHNHEAVKHSRLSDKIDFGYEWFGKNCSAEYFKEVRAVFDPLRKLRDQSSQKALWEDLEDKEADCYVPVLRAFIKELKRLDAEYPGEIPQRLIRYLIGTNDFYKVIMDSKRQYTKIESVNINGSLSKSLGKKKALFDAPIMKLPTKFYEIGFKEGARNTIIVVCNEGWNVSMRIHNASARIEPSLKFDVQLIATPNSIVQQIEPW